MAAEEQQAGPEVDPWDNPAVVGRPSVGATAPEPLLRTFS
jgi:hypothetical protein